MLRLLTRFLAQLLLAGGFIALVVDGTRSIAGGRLAVTSVAFAPDAIVRECVDSARRLEPQLGLTLDLAATPAPALVADPLRYKQVLLNLLLNAEQAMSQARDGGRLTVRTAATDRKSVV